MSTRAVVGYFTVAGTVASALGCWEPDHVVTVKCSAPDGSLSATVSELFTGGESIAILNDRQDPLGSLLRVAAGDRDADHEQWVLSYRLSTKTKIESTERTTWQLAIQTPLRIAIDGDDYNTAKTTKLFYSSVGSFVQSGTTVVFSEVRRQTLPDSLRTINGDQKALDVLRSAAEHDRYFIVSAVALGSSAAFRYDAWLFGDSYSRPYVGNSVFKLKDTYFHVNYSCQKFDLFGGATPTELPTLYFYTPVRYDRATSRARLDLRPFEPGFFAPM